jgi:hypothetical protein
MVSNILVVLGKGVKEKPKGEENASKQYVPFKNN